LIEQRLDLLLALGGDVLGHFVGLYDFVRYFNKACLELAQLLNEKQFKPFQIFLLLSQPEGQLSELLVEKFLLELNLTGELVSESHKLRVYL